MPENITRLFNDEIRDKKRTAMGVRGIVTNRYVHTLRTPMTMLTGKEKREYMKAGKVVTYNMKDILGLKELGFAWAKYKQENGVHIDVVGSEVTLEDLKVMPIDTAIRIYDKYIGKSISDYANKRGITKREIYDFSNRLKKFKNKGEPFFYKKEASILKYLNSLNLRVEDYAWIEDLLLSNGFTKPESKLIPRVEDDLEIQDNLTTDADSKKIGEKPKQDTVERKDVEVVNKPKNGQSKTATSDQTIENFMSMTFNIVSTDKNSCLDFVFKVLEIANGEFTIDIKVKK